MCPYSLTLPGGVQGQVLALAASLRAHGEQARVLAPCDGPPPEPWVTPLGLSIPTAANGSVAAIAPDPAAALRTLRTLRDEAFDVVHLHEPLVPGPALTALVSSDAALVGTFHRAGAFALSRTIRPLARWAASRLTVRCAVSADAEATASETLGGTYERVWNGIDVARYASAPPWPRPEGVRSVIMFVGRHEQRKGLAVLLDAFARLGSWAGGEALELWVVGEGPQTGRLRQATAGDQRIRWLGAVTDGEKRRRLRAADVLCAPSLYGESFGVILLEGMAAGTCVVASDLPGYSNVARAGHDAILVPPGDAEALAAALAAALEPGGGGPLLAKQASARAEEFSMERLARRYISIYERAIGVHGAVA